MARSLIEKVTDMARTRFTLTGKITDNLYVSQSYYPNTRGTNWGAVVATFFIVFILVLVVGVAVSI